MACFKIQVNSKDMNIGQSRRDENQQNYQLGVIVSDRSVFNQVSKVIAEFLWFCFTTLCDWFKKLASPTQPIRCKTKTNRDLVTLGVFPRLAPVTCICSEFSLVHCVIFVCCDWSLLFSRNSVKNHSILPNSHN